MTQLTTDPPKADFRPADRGSIGYVVMLTMVAALGGLLFGYDTAVVSGAIGFMQERYQLDDFSKGFAASSALLGCILGAAAAGSLSDRWGRRGILLLSAILFTVSAIGSAIPRNLVEFNIARILGGIGVGMASMLSPMYIAEISPAKIRGRLVSINQFAIVSGMLVVYFVNAHISGIHDPAWNVSTGWRWMFGSETLPAMLFMGLLFLVPESPRWLVKQGRSSEALNILTRVGGSQHATDEIADIEQAVGQKDGSWRQLLEPGLRMPLIIGMGLAILSQITGINTVIYYAPEIFKFAGDEAVSAIGNTVNIGVVNLTLTIVAIWVVDRMGRKPLLLLAAVGMGISLAMLGWACFHQRSGNMILFWLMAYVGSFAIAMGPVVWVVISEIFPTRIRGRAMSVATVSIWSACYVVSQLFPPMFKRLEGYTFCFYSAMCVLAVLFIAVLVPETKGKTLEQIERSWEAEK